MHKMTNPTENPTRIAFLLFDQFSNLCLSNALEPLRAANGFAAKPVYTWQFMTIDGAPVRSSSGMTVLPDGAVGGISSVDRLYVISSYGHLAHDTPKTRRSLTLAAKRSNSVLGLDTGAWLMAGAGLLSGRRATVHWDLIDAFSEKFLNVHPEQALWVADGPMITCAGAMATLDLSRHFIAQDVEGGVALDVEALFTPPTQPETPLPALGGLKDPMLVHATNLMRANLETPLSINALSESLGTSPRTLTRRCSAVLGLTPGQLYRHIRLSAARQMVENSMASVTEIALRCGYENAGAMTRAFRARFGVSPREIRQPAA